MASYYFSETQDAPHDERTVAFDLPEAKLTFVTDSGVFSRDRVDPGSALLIRTVGKVRGRALDLGCGYGPIGVALARLNPGATFVLSDVNARAADLCRRNIAGNRVPNAEAVRSDGFENIGGVFDLIVSNPPIRTGKAVLYPMWADCLAHLAPGGRLCLVIRNKQGAQSAKAYLETLFGACETAARGGGYHVLMCVRAI